MSRRRKRAPRIADGRVSYRLDGDALDDRTVILSWPGVNPANMEVYEPRSNQTVPKAGAWAMITRQLPPMERRLDEQVRVGRVFYVEQENENTDDEGFAPDGSYKVVCRSPWGELKLWPYEYSVIPAERLVGLWQDGALRFHPLAESEKQFSDVLFYAMSRGIHRADAVVMALGTLAGPVGWFEPATPELAEFCEGTADRINRWPWDDTKRRAARGRKEAG